MLGNSLKGSNRSDEKYKQPTFDKVSSNRWASNKVTNNVGTIKACKKL